MAEAETPETPAVPEGGTVRDSVVAAFEKHGAPVQNDVYVPDDIKDIVKAKPAADNAEKPPVEGRPRDATGKFTKGAEAATAEITDPDATAKPTAPVQTMGDAPAGWSAEGKAAWTTLAKAVAALPPEAQAAWAAMQTAAAKREEAASSGSRQWSEEKRRYEEMISPVAEAARARGIEPQEAIGRLIQAQNNLDRDPANAIRWLAQSYGVDLTQLVINPDYQVQGRQAPTQHAQPDVAAIVEQKLEERELQREIQAFAKDRPDYERLKPHMRALLESGAAESLEDAYDQARWAAKDIRERLLSEQAAKPADEQRRAEAQKVQKARSAAASLQGSPAGVPVTKKPEFNSVRSAVIDAWNRHAPG